MFQLQQNLNSMLVSLLPLKMDTFKTFFKKVHISKDLMHDQLNLIFHSF